MSLMDWFSAGTLERKIDRLAARLQETERLLALALNQLNRMESEIMANPQVERLIEEVQQTRGAIDSAVVYIQAVPELVRQAVEDALEANPGVDLTALSALADELDASQQKLTAALSANEQGEGEPAPETSAEPLVTPEEPQRF